MNGPRPPFPSIREELRRGTLIPFLGAGASLGGQPAGTGKGGTSEARETVPVRLPKGDELTDYLASKISFPTEESRDLAKVAQYYKLVSGLTPLKEALHAIFDRDYSFSPLHEYLASLSGPLLIITTNYDDLIERAFRDRPHDVVVYTTESQYGEKLLWRRYGEAEGVAVSPNKLDIDLSKVTVIFKMHGTVDRTSKKDQYVITEDDYIEFLTRMTRKKAIPSIFAEPFQQRRFLFLGYSLRDWNLRVLLNRIAVGAREGIKDWAVQYKPSELEKRFWQERRVEIFDMNIEDFVQELVAE